MSQITLTIKNRFIVLVALVVLFAVSLFITAINQIKKVKSYQELSESSSGLNAARKSLDSLEFIFLSNIPFDLYFYKTGNNKNAEVVVQYIDDLTQKIIIIQKNFYISGNQDIKDKATSIIEELSVYRESFVLCKNKYFEKGYGNYGINGQVNVLVDNLLDVCKQATLPQVADKLKEIVALKNSYLNEKEPAFINKIKVASDEAKTMVLLVNKPQKLILIDEIQKLQELIDKMHQIDITLGITHSDGLVGAMKSSKDLFELNCSELDILLRQELENSVKSGFAWLIVFFLLLLASVLLLSYHLNYYINKPLEKMKQYIMELVLGKLPDGLQFKKNDEISEMAQYLNKFVESLKAKAAFAIEIGKGKLDSKYDPLSEEDILGNALINMEKSLEKADQEDQKYKDDEKKRVWANEGIARFGEILRMHSSDISQLADEIVQSLVKYTNASQGGLFFYNDDDKSNVFLEMVAVFAFDRKKHLVKNVLLGEGLVGACAIEKQTIFVTDIPEDYMTINSGMGEAKPRSILLVPLKLEEEILGVVELSSFHIFEKHEIEFVEKIGQTIASTITGAKINARTAKLLEQSQKQAEEMAEQEEEMRQNMEELRTTQEDFARREAEISGFLGAIHSASLVLVFDMTGKIIDINQKLLDLMAAKHEDIVGRYHREFTGLTRDSGEEYDKFWADLRIGKSRSLIEKIRLASGKEIFLNQTFSPIFDKTGALSKVLCISTDVTDAKISEKKLDDKNIELANRNRDIENITAAIDNSMFKAEFSPDGRILNLNDNYCRITGHSKSELINKQNTLFMKEDEKLQFDKIWNEVAKGNAYTGTIRRVRPTGEEIYIMSSFTPIKDNEANTTKIYYIGMDITERKLKYQLLEEANKEIERLSKQKE